MAIDKEALQRDRDSGMSVKEIGNKHGCTPDYVYQTTKGSGAGRKSKSAGPRGKTGRTVGGAATSAMEELCEALWAAMPLEKRAELLKRTLEANL